VSYDRGVKLCAALPVFFFFKIVIDFVIYHSSQRDYKIRVYILSRKIFHQFKIFFKRGSQSQSPIQTGYYQAFISNAVDSTPLMASIRGHYLDFISPIIFFRSLYVSACWQ